MRSHVLNPKASCGAALAADSQPVPREHWEHPASLLIVILSFYVPHALRNMTRTAPGCACSASVATYYNPLRLQRIFCIEL
jgi:hypothetical protein